MRGLGKNAFVLSESENDNSKYATVKDFLDGVKVSDKDIEESWSPKEKLN